MKRFPVTVELLGESVEYLDVVADRLAMSRVGFLRYLVHSLERGNLRHVVCSVDGVLQDSVAELEARRIGCGQGSGRTRRQVELLADMANVVSFRRPPVRP